MRPDEVWSSTRTYLERHIRIDGWGLNTPAAIEDLKKPPSIARQEPVREFESEGAFEGMGPGPFVATVRRDFLILFRFSGAYKYEQLPHVEAESRMLLLLGKLRLEPECVHEDITAIAPTGELLPAQEPNGDWLYGYRLSLTISFITTPEELEPITNLMGF